MYRAIVLISFLSLFVVEAALAAPAGVRHVKASLVAETDAVTPGRPLVTGLRLQMDPGWHTYWRNPGDSGLPTKVKWTLPEGFVAGEIQWPRPGQFKTGPLVSYGYHDEVLLPMALEVPADLATQEVRLEAQVRWLECQDVCLPGKATLSLTLPVRAQASPGPAAGLFAAAREQLPEAGDGWVFGASADAASIALTVTPPRGTSLHEAYFYAVTPRVLDHAKPQQLTAAGGKSVLALPRAARASTVERLEGVLVGRTPEGPVALEVDVALAATGE